MLDRLEARFRRTYMYVCMHSTPQPILIKKESTKKHRVNDNNTRQFCSLMAMSQTHG